MLRLRRDKDPSKNTKSHSEGDEGGVKIVDKKNINYPMEMLCSEESTNQLQKMIIFAGMDMY